MASASVPRSPAAHAPGSLAEARMVEVVFPSGANHHGTLFGGTALALMAKAAFVVASRRAGPAVVLVAAEQVEFQRPVPVGSVVEYWAAVTRLGRSSMTIVVEGRVDGPIGEDGSTVMRGRFEMVAVDEDGRPRSIEPTMKREGTAS